MKVLLMFITILSLAAVVTLLAINYPGNVDITVADKAINFPLVFLIVGILALFLVLYCLLRAFAAMRRAPGAISKKRLEGRNIKARGSLKRGFLEMTEGQWAKAERSFTGTASKSEMPILNYLGAARVAQEQGNFERRDELLDKADNVEEKAELAVGLTRAELQHASGEYDAALTTLTALNQDYGSNEKVQKYLAKTLYARENWQELYDILPALLKNKSITEAQKTEFAAETYRHLLQERGDAKDREGMDELWKKIPKAYRQKPTVVKSYIRQLIHFGDAEVGAPFVRKYLKQNWSDDVVAMYSEFDIDGHKKGLAQSEKWLKEYPDSPGLLAMAGFLNAKAELWGKARSLLEQSLAIKAAPQTYKLLGDVLIKMDDPDAATASYQEGLRIAVDEADAA